jgi:DNA-binding response OmpR family regulator
MAQVAHETKILVADDDPEILGMLALRLKKRGYHVFEAQDGEAALAIARMQKPALIVLDVMMPKRSGWEVARALRSDERMKDIGIVMLTAIGHTMNEMTSPLHGADEYLDKPFEFEKLEETIAKVLERKR